MQVGTVTGREIRKNKDGVADVMLLQVEVSDPEDIQTVQLLTQAGEDSNPPDGSLVAILAAGEAWKLGVAVNDGIVPTMAKGEKKLYSSAAGVIKAFIDLLNNGDIEVNGEEIKIKGNALVEINADTVDVNGGTVVTIDAPTVDVNGGTVVTIDAPTVEINGGSDSAVSFSDLKTGFDTLTAAYNDLVLKYYFHTVHPPLNGVGTFASIDGAEVPTVKLP